MNKKKRNAIIIIVCFIIFDIGLSILFYNYVIDKRNLAFEKINLQINGNKEVEKKDKEPAQKPEDNNQNTEEKKETPRGVSAYIGTLEIPKINLTKGFVDMNSRANNVDYNIQIIKPSNYPDIENGNFIMASHSGSSRISYFKHLYKLSTGDTVNIYYNDIKYTYKIDNIYEQPKNGYVDIYRDTTKTTLTLITCTKNNEATQTIYICYLTNKENAKQ
ncbi:MAG: sortase [Bacilli bacterium]|nr:sortase [Bacilli bacterium]